jgi:hypothetical protein
MDCLRCGFLMGVREAGGMECRRCGEVLNVPEPVVLNRVGVFAGLVEPVVARVTVDVTFEPVKVGAGAPVSAPGGRRK